MIVIRNVQNKIIAQINFNFAVVLTPFAAIVYALYPENSFAGDPWMMVRCIFLQGIPMAVSQHFYMIALVLTDKSGIVAMVGFIGMVFSYFLSVVRYDEPLYWICVIGALMVMWGVYKIVLSK